MCVKLVSYQNYTKIHGQKNKTRFFVHHIILSAVKRVEFFSDRVSYIFQRGHWCNIIVLNVHAPSEEKSDDSKDTFLRESRAGFLK